VPVSYYLSADKWHNGLPGHAEAGPSSESAEVGFVSPRVASASYQLYLIFEPVLLSVEIIQQPDSASATKTPWMGSKQPAFKVSNGDPVIVPAGIIHVLDN